MRTSRRGPVTAADVARWGVIPRERERGLELLRGDLRAAEQAVQDAVRPPLRQAQFDALLRSAEHEPTVLDPAR